jgi:nitroimidazol reductase NimA-like FMN-containing flavoprotein (pyridoxamine 5'-phosphate oxidase superfamily)
MLEREMSRQECQDLLTRLAFGRLACTHDGQPYIVPVYFAFEPDHLYGFATTGQKIEWMRMNPLVCVEADEIRNHNDWASVVILGRYEEFPDTPEYSTRRLQAQAQLEKRFLWWQTGFAAAQTRVNLMRGIPVFYCIHIEEISGRRASADPVETSIGLGASEPNPPSRSR